MIAEMAEDGQLHYKPMEKKPVNAETERKNIMKLFHHFVAGREENGNRPCGFHESCTWCRMAMRMRHFLEVHRAERSILVEEHSMHCNG
jgi:hypothetical protein